MRLQNAVLVLATTGFAVGGIALPTIASASTGSKPTLTGVALKMVLGSKITQSASFELEIVAQGSGICSFDLKRWVDPGPNYTNLGHFTGTSATDEVQQSWGDNGEAFYLVTPYSCSGTQGKAKASESFDPDVFDDTYFNSNINVGWTVFGGDWHEVKSSKYFMGSALETTNAGAAVGFNDGGAFNDGIVIATGPTGGIATVTDNGKNIGTIDFYSAKPTYLVVGFKYGTNTNQNNSFTFTEAKNGKGGGVDMWFDADVQIWGY
jgi:hypothetical protein